MYIIQEHDAVRGWFWNIVELSDYANSLLLMPIIFALVLSLWVPAWLIDVLLKRLTPLSNKICDLLEKLISTIDMKFKTHFLKKM